MAAQYIFTKYRSDREYVTPPMSLDEALQYFSYTLECGRRCEREKGNKKINMNPKTVPSLVKQLNNAASNAANGNGASYSYERVTYG